MQFGATDEDEEGEEEKKKAAKSPKKKKAAGASHIDDHLGLNSSGHQRSNSLEDTDIDPEKLLKAQESLAEEDEESGTLGEKIEGTCDDSWWTQVRGLLPCCESWLLSRLHRALLWDVCSTRVRVCCALARSTPSIASAMSQLATFLPACDSSRTQSSR